MLLGMAATELNLPASVPITILFGSFAKDCDPELISRNASI